MKGMVFTEFVEFVEERFGLTAADDMIVGSDLSSNGIYTAVGTYDHRELLQMVQRLGEITGKPAGELVRTFGTHLLGRFVAGFPAFFECPSLFEFLMHVDDTIHVEVRKLYPDAELPVFDCEQPEPDRLVMVYQSHRSMADLAEGLIHGAIGHFRDNVRVQREDIAACNPQVTRFTLTRIAETP